MIDHTGLTVADVASSKAFYRAALGPLGYALIMEWEQYAGFGVPPKPDAKSLKSIRKSSQPLSPVEEGSSVITGPA